MKIEKITLVYFSGSGNTQKVLYQFAASFLDVPMEAINLTPYSDDTVCRIFGENELVVYGVPSFGGRIPYLFEKRLEQIHGYRTPSVAIVTYGARDYDDTLKELYDVVSSKSCKVIGAGAFVARHSLIKTIAADRPNQADLDEITAFAKQIRAKINAAQSPDELTSVMVKGNSEYKKRALGDVTPKPDRKCNNCKACAKACPTRTINYSDPRRADHRRCIGCMRCVEVCPAGARSIGKLKSSLISSKLSKVTDPNKANEIFI